MKPRRLVILVAAIAAVWSTPASMQQPPAGGAAGGGRQGGFGGGKQPDPIDFNEHDGWTSLFDGKTLNGWSGDSNWKVEDGAIVVEASCEKPTGTIYLVWQGGEAADFELKLEMKGTGDINGGVPRGTPPDAKSEEQWNMWGAQYDFDAGNRYTGQFYEQSTGRGIVAWKGQVVRTEKGKNPRLLATLGEPA